MCVGFAACFERALRPIVNVELSRETERLEETETATDARRHESAIHARTIAEESSGGAKKETSVCENVCGSKKAVERVGSRSRRDASLSGTRPRLTTDEDATWTYSGWWWTSRQAVRQLYLPRHSCKGRPSRVTKPPSFSCRYSHFDASSFFPLVAVNGMFQIRSFFLHYCSIFDVSFLVKEWSLSKRSLSPFSWEKWWLPFRTDLTFLVMGKIFARIRKVAKQTSTIANLESVSHYLFCLRFYTCWPYTMYNWLGKKKWNHRTNDRK